MKKYVATVNVPGYLPMDDDPPYFDKAHEAWQYLADERERGEQDTEGDTLSETWRELSDRARATEVLIGETGEGVIYGATPGYDGEHDLGLAYCVTLTDVRDSSDD